MVSIGIEYNGKMEHICSGALIRQNWIITAASCFDSFDGNQSRLQLTFGVDNAVETDNSNRRFIIDVKKHPSYKPKYLENNIAFVEFDKRIEFGSFVNPICQPDDQRSNLNNQTIFINGWGMSGIYNYGQIGHSLKNPIPTLKMQSRKWCNKIHNTTWGRVFLPRLFNEDMFCATTTEVHKLHI